MKTLAFALLGYCVTTARAEVVVYEGDVFPETAGWERAGSSDCDRWIQDQWLHQFCGLGKGQGPVGETDYYQQPLVALAGTVQFFVEWRVHSDVPASVIGGTPTVVSAFGNSGTNYHTTITDTRVRCWRDNLLPIIYVDYEAGPHILRVEHCHASLCGEHQFTWYIDGEVVHSGMAEGPYATPDSKIIWGPSHYQFDNHCQWDFVRYGTVPAPASGDFDSNGEVDSFDHFYFSECQQRSAGGEPAFPSCAWADFDDSNTVDCSDWATFKAAWTGLGSPPINVACGEGAIPATSDWGFAILTLLTLSAATILFHPHGDRLTPIKQRRA